MTAMLTGLLSRSLAAGLLVLLIVLFRWCFRRVPKRVHVLLWALVALLLLMPELPQSELSVMPRAVSDGSAVESFLDEAPEIIYRTVVPQAPEIAAAPALPEAPVSQSVPWAMICTALWLAGAAVMVLAGLFNHWRVQRRVAASVDAGGGVYLCDYIGTPFIMGLFRPRIYLPAAIKPQAAVHVLAHERVHLKRLDQWWKLLGYLLLCVHWFNPMLWLAYILLCRDIEMACDEQVVKNLDLARRKEYSTALLVCSVRETRLLNPLAFGEMGVKARILRVLHYKKPRFWWTVAGILAALLVAVCFLTRPKDRSFDIRITVPAGSRGFAYSEQHISPLTGKITVASTEGLGETSVVLKPAEGGPAETPAYLDRAMPTKLDAQAGVWYQIGIDVENPTDRDKDYYVTVTGVEVRIVDWDLPPETLPETTEAPTEPAANFVWQESFTGRDDRLNFHLDIAASLPEAPLDRTEVELHYLTEADVERAANALFPEAEFLDPTPDLEQEVFTKAEIQEKLDRWSSYNNKEALDALFLGENDDMLRILTGFIDDYTALYETAPDRVDRPPCPWTFRKQSYYAYSPEKLANQDLSREDWWIKAKTEYQDIPYTFLGRVFENWQESELNAYIHCGMNPGGMDEYIIESGLKRVDAPTREQVEAIRARAQTILDNMGLPNGWQVDGCYVDAGQLPDADVTEYTVKVTAVPVLNGIPAVRAWQRNGVWATTPSGDMPLTDAYFQFAPSGELLYFSLESPVSVVGTEPAQVLPMETLVEKARECLTAKAWEDYTQGESWAGQFQRIEESTGQRVLCDIHITEARYGLVRLPGEGTRYTYAPALILMGSKDFVGEQDGEVYNGTGGNGDMSMNRMNPIVIVNATDGSILDF
ncbi:MAG: DUF6034 family protein [Eubacteriales bacterium]|nr:DUF6034 family protein [Eubacteriales bacterium]